MDLARLEIVLRPRNHWEAIDLGFALGRRWFRPLLGLWLMGALPAAVLFFLVSEGNLVLLSLLLWWFKPLYEPPLMFWLSRAVFGERPTIGAVRRSWWRIVRPQLFANLTWRRFSSNRSFYMPVALLEGLKGKERKARIHVLGRRQQTGTWLTVAGIHFELILELCFLLTIYFLVPEELRWFHGDEFFFSPGPIDEWLQLACWGAAMALIAPFYVAAGFALYLHRRSELEGWDIEIGFRRTAENVASSRRGPLAALAALVLVVGLGMTAPQEGYAATEPGAQESKRLITQVLADPLFGRMEQQGYWKYVGKSDKGQGSEGMGKALKVLFEILKGFFRGIAEFSEIILWTAGLSALAYLLYHFSRNAQWMLARRPGKRGAGRRLPVELFGLDVRPDSLPEDVAAEALQRARAGELRHALSLLYRGTLVRLIAEHQLDIPGSATEGECLRLVQRTRGPEEADYFRQLTLAWQITAYAHLSPDAGQVERLCHDWRQIYDHGER